MDLNQALDEFEQALDLLDQRLAGYAETNADSHEAAEALARFEKIRLTSLKTVQLNFFQYALGCMSVGETVRIGNQIVSRGWTEKKKQWRHADLAEEVLKRLKDLSTSDDGEVTLTPRGMMEGMLKYAHIDYWRKGDLSELDINPDAYVDLSDEKEVVTVQKAK